MKLSFTLGLFVLCFSPWAQDFHFTQFDRSLMLLNPSLVGNFDGFERFTVQNRNQWITAGTQFTTSLAAVECTYGKNKLDTKSFVGFGAHFLRDVGGDARFGNTSVGASLSGNVKVSKNSKFSAGMQTSFTNRTADFSRLTYYSQWNGSIFDPSAPANETVDFTTFGFVDAGLGLAYSFDKRNANISQSNAKSFCIGVFSQHITSPKLRYNAISNDRLKRKWGIHAETELSLNSTILLELKTAQTLQGKHYEGNFGALLKFRFKRTAQLTRLKNDAWLCAGLYARTSGAISPTVYLDLGGFQFGFSYDQELSKRAKAYRSSIEFSLAYAFTKNGMFSTRKIR
jgi:type IX secretion system PorP/SprF family membrane protein